MQLGLCYFLKHWSSWQSLPWCVPPELPSWIILTPSVDTSPPCPDCRTCPYRTCGNVILRREIWMEDVLHWEGPAQFLSRCGSSQRVLCCCPLREVDLAAVISVQKSGVQNWDPSHHYLRPTWICGPRTWRSLTDWDRTWKSHLKVTTDQRVKSYQSLTS